MDSYEATRIVFSKIQALDPENASKIMGYVLIQDHGEKEMIRLAFGPESLLHSLILKAKSHLGLASNSPCTPSAPSSPSPFAPLSIPRPSPLSHHSPRFKPSAFGLPSPLAANPASPSSAPWHLSSGFTPNSLSAASVSSPSYAAAVVNGASNIVVNTTTTPACSTTISFAYCNSNNNNSNTQGDIFDDYNLHDHLSFLNESSSTSAPKNVDLFDAQSGGNSSILRDHTVLPYGMGGGANWGDSVNGDTQNHHLHRRSLSLSDVCFASEDSASVFGWKPCLYFARGFCKNGNSCKFLHGGYGDSVDSPTAVVGSPNKLDGFEQCQEMLRSKVVAQQQQRLPAAPHLMARVSFPYNKCMNFLMSDTQRSAAAALMMGEEIHKLGRCRSDRNDFSAMGMSGVVNPGSRQIYLTFPADSTFREEDVSNYFSIYGPVQDVRIPYQQKRMFGFVTFVYPETVKLILAKGNPHFVCESRVLVKPYKEKGKVPDKKQHQQQLERGDFSTSSSPTGIDSREPYDLHLGARMFYNTQEMLLRRKLEQEADLQQAIELQGRRLMNLQLLDLKNHHHHHHHHQYPHSLPVGSPLSSAVQSLNQNHVNQILVLPSDGINQEASEDCGGPAATTSPTAAQLQQEVNAACTGNIKERSTELDDSDLHESLEHILPDSLFASPKKSAGDNLSVFTAVEADEGTAVPTTTSSSNDNPLLPTTSTLNMAAIKSCSFHMPRFSSGHGAIEM